MVSCHKFRRVYNDFLKSLKEPLAVSNDCLLWVCFLVWLVDGGLQPFGQRCFHPFLAFFHQYTNNRAYYLISIRRHFFKCLWV